MKKLILISLLVLFGCDEDNPVASDNQQIELSWAYDSGDTCYYTDDDDICSGHTNIWDIRKLENIYLYDYVLEQYEYYVEICNCISYSSDINGEWVDSESDCSPIGCYVISDINYIQYK